MKKRFFIFLSGLRRAKAGFGLAAAGLLVLFFIVPGVSFAEDSFEISAWIPYWRSEEGVSSILPNMERFTEVNPFTYRVRGEGTLIEASPLSKNEWVVLRTEAREKSVRFIPTILWASADAIDATLKDPEKRAAHVRAIAAEVYRYDLDGIDIDYEGKFARTRPYFSLFLKELQEAIGYDRFVMCTIESRTPLTSRYEKPEDIPADIEYANDFKEINKHCDRVRIMAYDQERIDLKLNATNPDPYVAVADKRWVEKVMRLAALDIDKDKLLIGVPTYGYEYDTFPSRDDPSKIDYARLWSFNPGYAADVMQKLNLTPSRTSGGELSLVYPAAQSIDPSIPLPNATRVLVWSDAEAVRDKTELARSLGLRGAAVFKIDGGQDPNTFSVLIPKKSGEGATRKAPHAETAAAVLTPPARDLAIGMRHEDVRTLQKILNARGFAVSSAGAGSPGKETAYFGPATRSALIRFQQEKKIKPAAGYFGPLTRKALLAL